MPSQEGTIIRNCHSDATDDDEGSRTRRPSLTRASAYSWLPGMGLNLMPCNGNPTGLNVEASSVIAVQTTLTEVAAIAADPCRMGPMVTTTSK